MGKQPTEEQRQLYQQRRQLKRLKKKREEYVKERDGKAAAVKSFEDLGYTLSMKRAYSGWSPEELQELIDEIDAKVEKLEAIDLRTVQEKQGKTRKAYDRYKEDWMDGMSEEGIAKQERKALRYAKKSMKDDEEMRQNLDAIAADKVRPVDVFKGQVALMTEWKLEQLYWEKMKPLVNRLNKLKQKRHGVPRTKSGGATYIDKSQCTDDLEGNARDQAEVLAQMKELDDAQPAETSSFICALTYLKFPSMRLQEQSHGKG